ncbi:ABC-type multidrug transport system ATPase subunit [Pedobacter sp. UYP24]
MGWNLTIQLYYWFNSLFIMIGLHVDSVRKQFKDRQILNDVFISCVPGEIVGLLGRNGSGKSTLLKIIFGSLKAQNKYVMVDGKVSNTLFKNKGVIGYLPQDHFLPNHLKIRTLISCFCDEKGAIEIVNDDFLKPFLYKKSSQLSGGERRILEILMLLHSGAKYLLFDEPFNGISPVYIEVIKDTIKRYGKEKGVIITDHDYKNVLDLSTRIILMDSGNTKPIKELSDLVAFGYLPPSTKP